jgi:hypothetical protein
MHMTVEAQAVWDSLPEPDHEVLLASGFCARCFATRHFTLDDGEVRDGDLVLTGHCNTCGGRVVELVHAVS